MHRSEHKKAELRESPRVTLAMFDSTTPHDPITDDTAPLRRDAGSISSTVHHWAQAACAPAAPAALAAFIEAPEGVQWLRTMVAAAHWCISEVGGAGARVKRAFVSFG